MEIHNSTAYSLHWPKAANVKLIVVNNKSEELALHIRFSHIL